MDRMTLFFLGRVLGWLIVTGFVGAALNPVFKYINKNVMVKRPKDDAMRKGYQAFLKRYLMAHPYIGMTTAAIMLVHLTIQFSFYGFYLSGFIAGGLLLVQTGLGMYGHYVKKRKPGPWLKVHRWFTLVLLTGALIHVIIARIS